MLKKKIVKGMCCIATAVMLLGGEPFGSPVPEPLGIVQEVEAASLKLNTRSVTVGTGESV